MDGLPPDLDSVAQDSGPTDLVLTQQKPMKQISASSLPTVFAGCQSHLIAYLPQSLDVQECY